MKRGDIMVCTLAGDYGKSRPAVIVQSDLFNSTHASIVVCPVTSHIIEAPLFRLQLPVDNKTGLEKNSQIMVDKITAIRTDRIKKRIGSLSAKQKAALDKAIKLWMGV